ncbi:hypothetical protein CPB83DRAFT_131330 [Crepidotus variabilis]|uniref:F-box domain-containing protein n=1 Tax=Crepidotus variabilis TaxID=179855 RepID=A0A9P6ELZ7_9AGAR|nr:hypothetical protein CPB83DRAFT_131330 [Crepidotus variabilis]
MTAFQELPLEILLEIFGFLDPTDIVCGVRMVCHAFYGTSLARSLWKDLLFQVCLENGIFSKTFDPEAMSIRDFEHATTMPRRFLQTHLRKPSPDNARIIKPSSKHYIDFLDEEIYRGKGFEKDIIRLYLIPGGRYLLTHHSHSIHMWDLGLPGDPRGVPKKLPLGSIDLHEQGANGAPGLTPHPTRDGKGILLFTCLDDMSDINTCTRDVRVYSIYPGAPEPRFTLVKNFTVLLPGESYGLYKLGYDMLVMVLENQMRVWNFITNESAVWKIEIVGQYESIFLKDECIILCDGRGLLIWDVPPLHPCNSAKAYEMQELPPILTLRLEEEIFPDLKFNYEGLADWYYSTGQPFYFDFVVCPQRTVHLTRYRLDLGPLPKDETFKLEGSVLIPHKLKRLMSFTVPEDDGILEEFRVADDNIVMYWSAPNGLNIQSIPRDMESQGTPEAIVVVYEMAMVDRYLSTLCSSSGRVCHLLQPDIIEIADFIPHPNQVIKLD